MPVITPMLNGKRVRMTVSAKDSAKIERGPGFKGIVTNTKNGRQYRIYGLSCGLRGCCCDASAHPV